jgi:hypothetical protein
MAKRSNCRFNADANMGNAFGIFMAHVGTPALRAPAPVNLDVSP